jgi:hypothetical protein
MSLPAPTPNNCTEPDLVNSRRSALQFTKPLMADDRHHAWGSYAMSSGRKRRRDLV